MTESNQPQGGVTVAAVGEVVSDRTLIRIFQNLGRGEKAKLTRMDAMHLQSVISEVRRHRKLEHDHFWGEDDE